VEVTVAGTPETKYVKNGDVNITYQITGSGPVDLVYTGDWSNHLELDWDHPLTAGFLRRLGSFARLVRMNRRGQGLSDRRVPPTAIEEEITDIRAVMDAASCGRAVLFGTNEGAVRAAVFAATHPARVEGLILYAGYAKPASSEDYPYANPPEIMEMLLAGIEQAWGRNWGFQIAAPSAAADPSLVEYMNRASRGSMGPSDAAAMVRFTSQLDIRSVLPSINAPTLVLHRKGDRLVPVAQSHYLAQQIPDARLVEFSGDDNAIWLGDANAVLDEIEEFVTGTRLAARTNRALTTVLFTDIVGSTERAAELGDAAWRDLVSDHDDLMAGLVKDFGGKLVKSTGDGALATFEGPARAARCAAAAAIAARSLDLEIRAGLRPHRGPCCVGRPTGPGAGDEHGQGPRRRLRDHLQRRAPSAPAACPTSGISSRSPALRRYHSASWGDSSALSYCCVVKRDVLVLDLPRARVRRPRVKLWRHPENDQAVDAFAREGWDGFERPLPDLLVGCVRSWHGAFFDVGANTGVYALIAAASRRGVDVHAFEPFPPVVDILRKNVQLNRRAQSVRIIPKALSDRKGTAKLYVPPPTGLVETSCSLDPDFKSVDTTVDMHVDVETDVLDDYWEHAGRPAVAVLKVDAEGTDDRVLAGGCALIRQTRPVVFYEFLPRGRSAFFETLARGLDLVEVRLRPGEIVLADSVQFDDQAWNHALVPIEKLENFCQVAHDHGLGLTDTRKP
jgi:FkbM family methyltransferase